MNARFPVGIIPPAHEGRSAAFMINVFNKRDIQAGYWASNIQK